MKTCSKCKVEKEYTDFHKNKSQNDGYKNQCKNCIKVSSKIYRNNNKSSIKEYYQKNKTHIKCTQKTWRDENKNTLKRYNKEYNKKNSDIIRLKRLEWEKINTDKIKKYQKEWRVNNKKETLIYAKKYRENNRDIINNNFNIKYNNDPLFKLKNNIRSRIRESIKEYGYTKKSRTHVILGCSFEEFKAHLESQFEDWMSWDNYGNPKDGILEPNKSWDMDHIIPLSSAETEDDIIKLNHFNNLQPLCSYINRVVKRDSI